MPDNSEQAHIVLNNNSFFRTTHWSVVVEAGEDLASSPGASQAMGKLYSSYWQPIFWFVRRTGLSREEAQDFVQDLFVHLMAKNGLSTADKSKGRFRSFLLTITKHRLIDRRNSTQAERRGGKFERVSFDFQTVETSLTQELVGLPLPERRYDLEWAYRLLDTVNARFESEHHTPEKKVRFHLLRPFLVGDGAGSYAEAARKLGINEGTARKAVHDMRMRYRELFREEVAQTVATPSEVDEEWRYLCELLANDA